MQKEQESIVELVVFKNTLVITGAKISVRANGWRTISQNISPSVVISQITKFLGGYNGEQETGVVIGINSHGNGETLNFGDRLRLNEILKPILESQKQKKMSCTLYFSACAAGNMFPKPPVNLGSNN